jgi:hypothetical protein
MRRVSARGHLLPGTNGTGSQNASRRDAGFFDHAQLGLRARLAIVHWFRVLSVTEAACVRLAVALQALPDEHSVGKRQQVPARSREPNLGILRRTTLTRMQMLQGAGSNKQREREREPTDTCACAKEEP